MGSSKSAQVLMTRFNYMERGRRVWLIKPATDTRDGANIIRSRIGLEEVADVMSPEDDILASFLAKEERPDVVIADECQFFTESQILQMKKIVSYHDVPVLCFGLRTDFRWMPADELTELSIGFSHVFFSFVFFKKLGLYG